MRAATVSVLLFFLAACSTQTTTRKSAFSLKEVMIPMRDGRHLQTVIVTPLNQSAPLPILLERTPYGVPDKPPAPTSAGWNSRATATFS